MNCNSIVNLDAAHVHGRFGVHVRPRHVAEPRRSRVRMSSSSGSRTCNRAEEKEHRAQEEKEEEEEET